MPILSCMCEVKTLKMVAGRVRQLEWIRGRRLRRVGGWRESSRLSIAPNLADSQLVVLYTAPKRDSIIMHASLTFTLRQTPFIYLLKRTLMISAIFCDDRVTFSAQHTFAQLFQRIMIKLKLP